MINECDMQDKWVIISLSEDILIDTINLLNMEYYSSNVRKFEVSTQISSFFNYYDLGFDQYKLPYRKLVEFG